MHVVATAGHVDHGKSTLVRALTGTDPDRLEEERRRGLSIELGYAWTALPGVGDVAFVDVPGHQRFIATTLAGVGPVPVVMFVVAADDPWMPQAAEHLAALEALGVRHGVLVVTRADLAAPDEALARARAELAGTALRRIPHAVVSGRTAAGLDRLRQVLGEELAAVPSPDPAADVRLWVDRRFHVRGAGAVVTGTLPAGTVRVGDVLQVGGDTVRVRAMESLGRPVGRISGVARVALDLGGRAPATLTRGSALLTPDAFVASATVDVRVTGEGPLPQRPLLHVGSTFVAARVRPLGAGHVRLGLDRPLPLRVGDRVVLRDPGSRTVWGATVLDPTPPRLARRGDAAKRGRELAEHDGSLSAHLRIRRVGHQRELRRLGLSCAPAAGVVRAGEWLVTEQQADEWRERLAVLVRSPAGVAAGGVPVTVAVQALHLPDAALVPALLTGTLRVERGRVVDTEEGLPPGPARALARLEEHLAGRPFAAPETDLLAELGLDPATVAGLSRAGHLLRLPDSVLLLPDAPDLAVERLRDLPAPFTASQARQALDTSRRVALPLLRHLDRIGRTVRLPDDTRRLRRGPV